MNAKFGLMMKVGETERCILSMYRYMEDVSTGEPERCLSMCKYMEDASSDPESWLSGVAPGFHTHAWVG